MKWLISTGGIETIETGKTYVEAAKKVFTGEQELFGFLTEIKNLTENGPSTYILTEKLLEKCGLKVTKEEEK